MMSTPVVRARLNDVIVVVLILCSRVTSALQCYSCQYSPNDDRVGYDCVKDPSKYRLGPGVVQCGTATDCVTEIQTVLSSGDIYFLSRGCRTKQTGCYNNGVHQICVTSCSSDDGGELCNSRGDVTAMIASVTSYTTSTASIAHGPDHVMCYSCVYSYNPTGDTTCLTDPGHASPPNVVTCHKSRVCTITRMWDKHERVIRSFSRGCELLQGRSDRCVDDVYFNTCLAFCRGHHCNSGDGLPRRPSPPPATIRAARTTTARPTGYKLHRVRAFSGAKRLVMTYKHLLVAPVFLARAFIGLLTT